MPYLHSDHPNHPCQPTQCLQNLTPADKCPIASCLDSFIRSCPHPSHLQNSIFFKYNFLNPSLSLEYSFAIKLYLLSYFINSYFQENVSFSTAALHWREDSLQFNSLNLKSKFGSSKLQYVEFNKAIEFSHIVSPKSSFCVEFIVLSFLFLVSCYAT